ncbi:MAG TPA: hypothetical protein PKE45_16365, partial [Caldilineaceae bacterium]|nr:hypothetical protein [Caldilineaceae bacterium]
KDLQNLTKEPTSTTTAKPSTTKPATTSTTAKTTKPATTTGSTAAAGSTTGKSEAKAKPTEKPATGSAGDGIPESSGSTENSILPPLAPAPEPSAETENAHAPADSLSLSGSKAEQPPAAGETSLPSTTAVSVNGIGVNGATDPGESGS